MEFRDPSGIWRGTARSKSGGGDNERLYHRLFLPAGASVHAHLHRWPAGTSLTYGTMGPTELLRLKSIITDSKRLHRSSS